MQVRIQVTDDQGRVFAGGATLMEIGVVTEVPTSEGKVLTVPGFDLPVRAWAKRHAHSKSGAQIFALLAAYVAKGDLSQFVALSQIEKLWSRMTSVLGIPYNPKHSTRAKEFGWVDSPSHGKYKITATWSEAMKEKKAS